MIKATVLSAAFLIPTLAEAQEYLYPREMPCISYDESKQYLKEYDEVTLFLGSSVQPWINFEKETTGESRYILEFNVNQLTGTWSIVQIYEDGTSCLMSTGTEFTPYTE